MCVHTRVCDFVIIHLLQIHSHTTRKNTGDLTNHSKYISNPHKSIVHSEPLKTWQFIFDYNFG